MSLTRPALRARVLGAAIGSVLAITITTAAPQSLAAGRQRVVTVPTAPIAAAATVGDPTASPPVPPGFLGISTEYDDAAALAGPANDPDTVFEQLVRQLAPGQRPVIRIGGDSTDRTWWPLPTRSGRPSPGTKGLIYALTPAWAASIARMTDDLDARLILGINLEADSARIATYEASELIAHGIHHASIAALEMGNEPSLYGTFGWYYDGRRIVTGRPASYDIHDYLADVARVFAGLRNVPLAGPALGDSTWLTQLARIVRAEPRAATVTYHAYPLSCYGVRGTLEYPSVANMLAPESSIGLAAGVAAFANIAHANHRLFRVDELGPEACGGTYGVSNTFASALWALNTLFAMAKQGVDGVNVHTFPGAAYRLFSISRRDGAWQASVAPEYYGLLSFAALVPAGSRLLATSTRGDAALQTWAVRAPGGDTPRIALVNSSTTRPALVTLSARTGTDDAQLAYLTAPSAYAKSGATLAGDSFGPETRTGRLAGPNNFPIVPPVAPGTYRIDVPAASAVLVTFG